LERFHLKVDVVAEQYVAEGLLSALAPYDLNDARILIPRAAIARDILPSELARRGAHVDVAEAYRTVVPPDLPQRAQEAVARRPDWITFSSSSTVQNLVDAIGAAALNGVRVASIGPITSETLRKCGISVDVEAASYTISGLVASIIGR
jgi:uroporphyrinogen III methyltransferase/synthase